MELAIPGPALTKRVEPDGKEFLDTNYVINLWTKNKFVFDALLGENVNVRVINDSKIGGAALAFSRFLESAGLRVVEVSTGEGSTVKTDKCSFLSAGSYSFTTVFLKNYLGCKELVVSKKLEKGEGITVWVR